MTTTSTARHPASVDVPEVHRRAIIVDGHCDTPSRLNLRRMRISDPDPSAQADLAKLEASGITASFFASYVPPFYAGRGAAKFADTLIDVIERAASDFPERLTLGRTAADIRKAKADGRIALMIGVEGGHAIEDSLETLDHLYRRGARYMTLTHVNTNNWADSSGDAPRHGGLTQFGREVVRSMNDLGMMVDISHVADTTFYHVMETARVPPIASHSSCRAIANHPRNMTDQMLRDLASVGGICMINFFSAFIDPEASRIAQEKRGERASALAAPGTSEEEPEDPDNWDDYCRWFADLGCPRGTVDSLVDHIVHAASIAGVDAVGLGSDFDGVPLLPEGMESVAALPLLTARMLDRGFHEPEVEKILGTNLLRVLEAVEAGAKG